MDYTIIFKGVRYEKFRELVDLKKSKAEFKNDVKMRFSGNDSRIDVEIMAMPSVKKEFLSLAVKTLF